MHIRNRIFNFASLKGCETQNLASVAMQLLKFGMGFQNSALIALSSPANVCEIKKLGFEKDRQFTEFGANWPMLMGLHAAAAEKAVI